MHKKLIFIIGLFLTPVVWCTELRLQDHPSGIWSITSTKKETRWLIIHDLALSRRSGVYHVEVLSRGVTEPVWKAKHLMKHLAISEAALLRSLISPLKKGAVYPETFDEAYQAWKSQNKGLGGAVCQTEVVQCLQP